MLDPQGLQRTGDPGVFDMVPSGLPRPSPWSTKPALQFDLQSDEPCQQYAAPERAQDFYGQVHGHNGEE